MFILSDCFVSNEIGNLISFFALPAMIFLLLLSLLIISRKQKT